MTLLTWNHTCSVGVRAMDDQHGILMDTINELQVALARGCNQELVTAQLEQLVDFTGMHFWSEEKLMELKANGYTLSTSIHRIEERDEISSVFDYAFFGPVFNSISKKGYTSTLKDGSVLPKQKLGTPAWVAIGGIETSNIGKIRTMGFQGAAVLGAIWENPSESVQQFKALQKAWNR